MNETSGGNQSDMDQIGRRTIINGAAWSIPAIALTVVAPAASATTFSCPVLPPPNAWVMSTAGTLSTSSGTTGADANRFVSQQDVAVDTGGAGVDFVTVIPVVAGRTYTMTFHVDANYANGGGVFDTSAQGLDVFARSDLLYRSWTRERPGFDLLPVEGSTTVTVSFVASSTQSLPLRLSFGLQPRYTGNAGNDDIRVTAPVLACE